MRRWLEVTVTRPSSTLVRNVLMTLPTPLTPKPSLLPIGNKLLERRSLQHATARLHAVGCCCEAAHLKRTGQGYNSTSGTFPLRPHPRQRQPSDSR